MASPTLDSHSDQTKNPPKLYGFHTFAKPGCPITPTGAFRDNVRRFLQECANPEDYNLDGMLIWRTFLVYERTGTVLPLYTVEENVERSDRPLCDYCRCVGWSHHFVSKRKYRFIIPNVWGIPTDEGFFDKQAHLLHGLIHCNGFGHLICINGIEGGSHFVYGEEIMDLWDRICSTLCVRQITVEDLSKKREMELRLLYGVAYGHTWFGKWGYRFFHGSFGVKEHHYEAAIGFLSSLVLDEVIEHFSLTDTCINIKQIIHHYRLKSGKNLVTIRDLFRYLLTVRSRTSTSAPTPSRTGKRYFVTKGKAIKFRKEKPAKCRKLSAKRWPVRRLELVAEAIVDALKKKRGANKIGCTGMTWQEAPLRISDTELRDRVQKALNNSFVGNHRSSKVMGYTIQDFKGCQSKVLVPSRKCRNMYSDVVYLYRNVLLRYPDSEPVELAAQVILYSKHFVKEFPFREEYGDSLKFICRLLLSSNDHTDDVSYDFMPVEYVAVPLQATTAGDLKIAVQNAFCDSYCALEKLRVTEILELEGVEDDEDLSGIVESGIELRVKGSGIDPDCETTHCCGIGDDEAKTGCSSLVTVPRPKRAPLLQTEVHDHL